MRWIKHLTRAHADPEIDGILEEFGAEGYGVYWLLVEEIAEKMEGKNPCTRVVHSDVKWASIVRTSVRKWRSIAKKMNDRLLIVVRSTDNRIEIDIPKILKYKDEYARKSGVAPDSRTEREQIEIETTDYVGEPPPSPHPRKPPGSAPIVLNGNVDLWPMTAGAIRATWPTTDDGMVMQVVHASVRTYSRLMNGDGAPLRDDQLSQAVAVATNHSHDQHSAALYKTTVPQVIESWVKENLHASKSAK